MLFYKLVEASLTNMSFTYQRENKTKRWHVNTLVKQQYLFDLHCRDELNVNLLFTDSTSTLSDNWNKCNVLSTSTESYCGQIETLTKKLNAIKILTCYLQLLSLSYTAIHIHTQNKTKNYYLYVSHTYHMAGYQKRQGSRMCKEVKPCYGRCIFVQNWYVHLTGDHKSRRSHVWVALRLWGSEGSNKVYSGTARCCYWPPFLSQFFLRLLGALCLPWLEQARKDNLRFEPLAQSKIS